MLTSEEQSIRAEEQVNNTFRRARMSLLVLPALILKNGSLSFLREEKRLKKKVTFSVIQDLFEVRCGHEFFFFYVDI